MVDRYKVSPGELASPVVGTPGVDPSAGKAAEAVGQMADQDRNLYNQAAMQRSQNSQQMFNNAASHFQNFAAQQHHNAMMNQAIQNEQRKQQVQLDLDDERQRINDYTDGLKENFGTNPQGASAQFKNDLPQLQQQFQQRYAQDPVRLRMMMQSMRGPVSAAMGDVKTWAQGQTTQILNTRLANIPQQVSDSISALAGDMGEQIQGYQKMMNGKAQIYAGLKASAMTEEARNNIDTKFGGLVQNSGKQLVDHLASQIPDGEQGLHYLDTLHGIVGNSRAFGIHLDPEQQKQQMGFIAEQYKNHQGEVVQGTQTDSAARVIDLKLMQQSLFNAADDPKQMTVIKQQVQQKFDDLTQQAKLVEQQPDSPIKKAKMLALKEQQGVLIGETGQQLKEQQQHTHEIRAQEANARSLVMFAHSMTGYVQGQQRFQQWQQDLLTKKDNQAATAAHTASVDGFNQKWAKVVNDSNAAWGIQPGPKQQAELTRINQDAVPMLFKAVTDGAISGPSYGAYLKQLKGDLMATSTKKQTDPTRIIGPIQFGGGVQALKGNNKIQAIAKAQQDFGLVVAKRKADFNAVQSGVAQLGTLTQSKGEKAFLTQYTTTNMPTLLNSPGYQKLSPEKQQAMVSDTIKKTVTQFRQGVLQ